MSPGARHGAARRARGDGRVARLLLAHLLGVVGEWAVGVGLLVYAFEWGGSRAVGVVAVALVLPSIIGAPLVAAAMARWRTHAVRLGALGGQVVAYGGAAAAAYADAPAPFVVALVVGGVALTTAIPPTSIALLPRVARTAGQLVTANLRLTYCDAASAVVGALASAVVLGVDGPASVFLVVAAGATVALVVTAWRPGPLARAARGSSTATSRRVVRGALAELRASPWSRGVLGVASARNIVVGAFDVLLVVVAFEALGLSDGGPGYLAGLVGAGALASTFLTTAIIRRTRLRGGLMVALVAAAGLAVLLGVRTDRATVFAALPLMGLAMATMDALSRTLLQRSTDPRSLGSMFAALGLVAGGGQVFGSATAQVALAAGGLRAGLVALAAVLVVLAVLSAASLRRADEHAAIPSVEMALLAGLPMLAPLPTAALERVARTATTLDVPAGAALVVEGEPTDSCYVVADGSFDVGVGGRRVRGVGPGDVIGEVALLVSAPATATLTAATPGVVVRIARDPFLVALTGQDPGAGAPGLDFSVARERFRDVVAARQREGGKVHGGGADSWLGLGAVGRALADPTFFDALSRGVALAQADGDSSLLAEAAVMTAWPGVFFHVAAEPSPELIDVCEEALARLAPDDPRRVRVLATLASNLTFATGGERRFDLIREAHDLAGRLGRADLVGVVLNAEFLSGWDPGTLARREVIAARLVEIGKATGDADLAFLGGFFGAYCAAERVRLADARQQLEALRTSLPATHNQYFEFLTDRLLLAIDIATDEPDAEARVDALVARHEQTHADTTGTWALQTGFRLYRAGSLGDFVPAIEAMLAGPLNRTWPAALALAHLESGDAEAAAAVLDTQRDVPRDYFWVTVKQVQADVAAGLGRADLCAPLFDDLAPHRGRLGITASGTLLYGLVSRSLGGLALVLARYEEAVDLLREAVTQADAASMPFEAVIARRLLAHGLRELGALDEARTVVAAAATVARERGYERELLLLNELARP